MTFQHREAYFRASVLIILSLTYGFAGFIKINANFLDPELTLSCSFPSLRSFFPTEASL